MNGSARCAALLCLSWVLSLPVPEASATVLLEDGFDGTGVDMDKWCLADPGMVHGQSRMGLPPVIHDGMATFEHHTYDPENPGLFCLGSEIRSRRRDFYPDGPGREVIEIEVRTRFRTQGIGGVVGAAFLYMDEPDSTCCPQGLVSDEIDMEFLSNQIVVFPDHVGHHPVLAAYGDFCGQWYDGVHHWFTNPTVPGLNLQEFNIFKLRWRLDSVEWFWQSPDGTDVLLAATVNAVPDDPMALYLNTWASDDYWPLAWQRDMRPGSPDRACYFDVDYVRASCIPEPSATALVLWATSCLVGHRHPKRRNGRTRSQGGSLDDQPNDNQELRYRVPSR